MFLKTIPLYSKDNLEEKIKIILQNILKKSEELKKKKSNKSI